MEKNKNKIIFGRVALFAGTILLLLLFLKLAVFFIPFLIAGIIALLIEPVIKFGMKRLKLSRKASSLITVTLTVLLIGYVTVWGVTQLTNELVRITNNINPAITELTKFIDSVTVTITEKYPDVSPQVAGYLEDSAKEAVKNAATLIATFATTAIKIMFSVPTVIVNVVITILALVLFTKDREYISGLLSRHFPESWVSNGGIVIKEIFSSIGGYLKIYAKIMLITFIEVYLAFKFIFKFFGLVVPYPLAFAIVVAVVDILPILGVGTILIPWSLLLLIMGEFGFSLVVILTYVAITIIRNFIEPKLVSNQFGIHPIITLLAMYAGLRLIGVVGLLLGPIMITVLRCIFDKQIKNGLFKEMFAED